jgi:general secretion pathway protein A
VIDEAQSLTDELLEEVRLLANIESATEKLLPLVLAGQPQLRDRLNDPALMQLKQRVTLRCEVAPFNVHETAAYIAARIRTAGGDATRLFTRDAVVLIHEHSGGIPRTISVMCDNALLTCFGLGLDTVNEKMILEVVRDFDLKKSDGEALEMSADQRALSGPVAARGAEAGAVSESAAVTAELDQSSNEAQMLFGTLGKPSRFSFLRRS